MLADVTVSEVLAGIVTVTALLASAATAHFQKTNWSTTPPRLTTFVPVIDAHALPPLASVGTAGTVAVEVVALPVSWIRSRSLGLTVAGSVTVNVPDAATLVAVATVRKAAGSIVYGSGSFVSSSHSVRYCLPFFVSRPHCAACGVMSLPSPSRILTGAIPTGISLFRLKNPTQPLAATRAWRGVSRSHCQLCSPSERFTVRKSSTLA